MAAVAAPKICREREKRKRREERKRKEEKEKREDKKERKGEKSKRERCRCIRPMSVKHPLEMAKKDYKHDKRHEKGGLNLKKQNKTKQKNLRI